MAVDWLCQQHRLNAKLISATLAILYLSLPINRSLLSTITNTITTVSLRNKNNLLTLLSSRLLFYSLQLTLLLLLLIIAWLFVLVFVSLFLSSLQTLFKNYKSEPNINGHKVEQNTNYKQLSSILLSLLLLLLYWCINKGVLCHQQKIIVNNNYIDTVQIDADIDIDVNVNVVVAVTVAFRNFVIVPVVVVAIVSGIIAQQ